MKKTILILTVVASLTIAPRVHATVYSPIESYGWGFSFNDGMVYGWVAFSGSTLYSSAFGAEGYVYTYLYPPHYNVAFDAYYHVPSHPDYNDKWIHDDPFHTTHYLGPMFKNPRWAKPFDPRSTGAKPVGEVEHGVPDPFEGAIPVN